MMVIASGYKSDQQWPCSLGSLTSTNLTCRMTFAISASPRAIQISALQLIDSCQHQCSIIDLLLSGTAIEIEAQLAIGVQIMLGTIHG